MEAKLICISIDILMVIISVIMGMLFINSKGKGCNYLTGYNMKDQEERKKYDEEKICKYFGKIIMSWTIYFIIGSIVDYTIPGVGLTFAFILWSISFSYQILYIRIRKFDELFKTNSISKV